MYSIKLYIDITTSRAFPVSTWVLFIWLTQSINGAQHLNVTPLFISPICFAESSAHAPAFVIIYVPSIYTLV